jgi:hypothetical protein
MWCARHQANSARGSFFEGGITYAAVIDTADHSANVAV